MALNAADILAVDTGNADRLFPGNRDAVAKRFRGLARSWHPDRNPAPEAATVFAHITQLHRRALSQLGGNVPVQERRFQTLDGRTYRFAWASRHRGDCGEVLVGAHHIAFVVPTELANLIQGAARIGHRFADARMQAEMKPRLPCPVALLETDAGHLCVYRKRPDQWLLADLLKLAPLDPRHAAWITTRLLGLACWLEYAGISHGAIGPEWLLVSPRRHDAALTGPMLCAARFGQQFSSLPERTLALLPRLEGDGSADARVDLELVRLTLRELLGDPGGTRLGTDPDFPPPFARWLLLPSAGGAQADLLGWEQARDAAFGPRRFVQWDVDPAALRAA